MPSKRFSTFNLTGRGHSLLALAWLVIVTLCAALLVKHTWLAERMPIETDILKLLPTDQQNPLAERAFGQVSQSVSDQVVFLLSSEQTEPLFSAAKQLQANMSASGYFAEVSGKITPQQQSTWSGHYFEQRFQQLTETQRQRLSQQPQHQRELALQQVYNPFAGVTGQELSQDPFLLFREYLAQLGELGGQFKLQDGYLVQQQAGRHYLLMSARLTDSPYSMHSQQLVPLVDRWQLQLAQQFQVDMLRTGVLFYADFGTRSAKQEISTIGAVSLAGIVLLVLLVFRSFSPLWLALLSVAVGCLVALSCTLALFGRIHLFSLVFGTSLIGVSIDYAFHYLTDRLAAGQKWQPIAGLHHVLAAITLGLVTSLIGYLGLLVAPFPGLQQLALFSAFGLTAAYATVVCWYPLLAHAPGKPRSLPGASWLNGWLSRWQQPLYQRGLPALLLGLALLALTQIRFNDDIRQLQAMPDSLKQQEQQIAQLSGLQSSPQMLVVSGENDEQLMQQLEQLQPKLDQWQQQGIIAGYQSLSQYHPSQLRQRSDHSLIRQLYLTQGQTLADTLGLAEAPQPGSELQLQSLASYLSDPVSAPLRFLYLGRFDGQVSAVVMLRQLTSPDQVKQFAEQAAQILYLDKTEDISQLFGQYRAKVLELLLAATLAIALLLTRRYGLRHAIRIVLPSVIAAAVALGIAALASQGLNLFHLLALVLILGIGIDYTLFFAENARSPSTLLAITLSSTTTLLSFGLLALSQTHAIHSFGLTLACGITVAWLLSPMAINEPSAKRSCK
ncbi:MMPL family transporter [Vibrio sp.]|uniref:MMPL family transporter n=1 Tax=Vibrio sp. TaxID=678 RepID=UPI003D0D6630